MRDQARLRTCWMRSMEKRNRRPNDTKAPPNAEPHGHGNTAWAIIPEIPLGIPMHVNQMGAAKRCAGGLEVSANPKLARFQLEDELRGVTRGSEQRRV